MKASDFQSTVLSELATLKQQMIGVERSISGEDGFHAFKREVDTRLTEAHVRINRINLTIAKWSGGILVAIAVLEWMVKR